MFFFFFDEANSSVRKVEVEENSASRDSAQNVVNAWCFPVASSVKEEVLSSKSEKTTNVANLKSATVSSSSDANLLNEQFLARLDEEKEEIIYLMLHEVIEDGVENEVISTLRPFCKENKYMLLIWLYRLYAHNQTNSAVFSGILDVLYCLDVKQSDFDLMISLVSNGLNSPFSIVQETAIKVTEKWRTKECLDALKLAKYSSPWMESYAQKVIVELEQELLS